MNPRPKQRTQFSSRTGPQVILTAYWVKRPETAPGTAFLTIMRGNWEDWKYSADEDQSASSSLSSFPRPEL